MESRGFNNGARHPGDGLLPGSGKRKFGWGTVCPLSIKWSALHEAAETVALIAGASDGAMSPEAYKFPIAMRDASMALRHRAEQGVADITAILEPSLCALLARHAGGADPAPAAYALWHEFLAARDEVMSLAPQELIQPRRVTV